VIRAMIAQVPLGEEGRRYGTSESHLRGVVGGIVLMPGGFVTSIQSGTSPKNL